MGIICKFVVFYDKSKPVEKPGRKARGPVKWQPATERKVSKPESANNYQIK